MRNLKSKTSERKIRNTKARIKNQDMTAGVKASTSIEAVVEAEAQKEEEKRAQARLKRGTIKTETTEIEETGIGRRILREIKKETGDTVAERGIVSVIVNGIVSVIVSVIGNGKGKRKKNVIARRKGNVIARRTESVRRIGKGKGIVKGIKEDQSIKAIAKEAKGTNEIEAIDFLI